jgi:class 3 adenylate cyclase
MSGPSPDCVNLREDKMNERRSHPPADVADAPDRLSDERKLTAVVHADVVGYSRLIGIDDVGTLSRLKTLRRELIDAEVQRYGGKIIGTAGDALLMTFDSIHGAVRCAIAVQRRVPDFDGDHPPAQNIRFRSASTLVTRSPMAWTSMATV